MKLIIPAYWYPSPGSEAYRQWQLLAVPPAPDAIDGVIYNPASGPGTTIDPNYLNVVTMLKKASVSVFGYVATTWGDKDQKLVLEEIRRHYEWYSPDGIFFDEGSTQANKIPYYRELYSKVAGRVIINPGTSDLPEGYVDVADTICNFESSMASYRDRKFPSWVNKYPDRKFYHIVFGASLPDLDFAMSRDQRPGYLYMTTLQESSGNPFSALPPWYQHMVRRMLIKP